MKNLVAVLLTSVLALSVQAQDTSLSDKYYAKQMSAAGMLTTAELLTSMQVTNAGDGSVGTTNPATGSPNTLQGDVSNLLGDVLSTNWYFGSYYLHAGGLAAKKDGFGFGAFRPLSQYVLTGLRLDYVGGDFWMPSGNATFQVPITPISSLKWLTVSPFGYVGVGIPVAGATVGTITIPGQIPRNNDGQPTAILGYGASIALWKNSSATSHFHSIELVGDKETWTGFGGNQYRIGIFGHVTF